MKKLMEERQRRINERDAESGYGSDRRREGDGSRNPPK
jgi:hypothetical protein